MSKPQPPFIKGGLGFRVNKMNLRNNRNVNLQNQNLQ